jgi:hypothetical protein
VTIAGLIGGLLIFSVIFVVIYNRRRTEIDTTLPTELIPLRCFETFSDTSTGITETSLAVTSSSRCETSDVSIVPRSSTDVEESSDITTTPIIHDYSTDILVKSTSATDTDENDFMPHGRSTPFEK